MKRVLLDTNVLLWAACSPMRLSAAVVAAFTDAEVAGYSIVSLWEIGLKFSRGSFNDLEVPKDWDTRLVVSYAEQGIRQLPVEVAHFRLIQDLPFHHKDPFDRILIAQALHGDWEVISSDGQFDDKESHELRLEFLPHGSLFERRRLLSCLLR